MSTADTFLVSGHSFNAAWFPAASGVEISLLKIPLQTSPFFLLPSHSYGELAHRIGEEYSTKFYTGRLCPNTQ